MMNRITELALQSTPPTAAGQHATNAARPDSLSGFIGQEHLKLLIATSVTAAKIQNQAFPHTLISGAAGLGKTSMSKIIAKEMGCCLIPVSCDELTDAVSVRNVMARLDYAGYDSAGAIIGRISPAVLFVDEVHRMSRQVQELLYIALEDRVIQSPHRNAFTGATEVQIEWLPLFTLVAATNRPSAITNSFRDRLPLHLHVEPYTLADSAKIAHQTLGRLGLRCGEKAAQLVAERGRGVPRRIIGICEHIRSVCVAKRNGLASTAICEEAFQGLGLDQIGLTRQDVQYLASSGTPVGIKTISGLLGEEESAIEASIEPYLISSQLILRSPRGRSITAKGREHLRAHHGAEGTAVP